MAKVIINIDWVPDNFGAAPANQDIASVATGKTLEEVENNIVEALRFHVEGMLEDGEPVPDFLMGEWEPEFHLSTRAQLKYTDNYITRKALARETGIAEQHWVTTPTVNVIPGRRCGGPVRGFAPASVGYSSFKAIAAHASASARA